jgi:hypothetical protein
MREVEAERAASWYLKIEMVKNVGWPWPKKDAV